MYTDYEIVCKVRTPPITTTPSHTYLGCPSTTDEYPCIQAAPLARAPALFRFRGIPRYTRARVHPGEHPPAPRQSIHEPVLGRGDRDPTRGPRALPQYRRGAPATPGSSRCCLICFRVSCVVTFWDRRAARSYARSCKIRSGTGPTGPEGVRRR
jgi:hypothetical protein